MVLVYKTPVYTYPYLQAGIRVNTGWHVVLQELTRIELQRVQVFGTDISIEGFNAEMQVGRYIGCFQPYTDRILEAVLPDERRPGGRFVRSKIAKLEAKAGTEIFEAEIAVVP